MKKLCQKDFVFFKKDPLTTANSSWFSFSWKATAGGGSAKWLYLQAQTKTPIFENGQFSRHFVFDKNKLFFFWRKKIVYPHRIDKNFVFLKKKIYMFFFFEKKCFFWGNFFFRKNCFQNFKKFSAHTKFVKIFLNFFQKKHKLLFIGVKTFFSPKTNYFYQKQSVHQNIHFQKWCFSFFSYKYNHLSTSPPSQKKLLCKKKKKAFNNRFILILIFKKRYDSYGKQSSHSLMRNSWVIVYQS